MEDAQVKDDSQIDVAANPEKYHFLKDLDVDSEVSRRLTLHLDRLNVGDSSVFTSPLGREHNPKSILDSWTEIFESKRSEMNDPLLSLEQSNFEKFSPRSIARPWSDRVDGIKLYYHNKNVKLPYDIYSGIKTLSRGTLRPLSIEAAAKLLKSNTNSGLPYYTKKGYVRDRVLRKLEYLLSRRDPCILFTRTQENDKTRNVWGYPCADTLEEMRYYSPLLTLQRRLPWRSALMGPDFVDKSVTQMLLKCKDNGYSIFSGDISAFDANVCIELSRAAFYYIKQLFQIDFRSGLDRICDRFTSIGLLTPSGITEGYHGVPSGSTFTNEVDSIVQYLILKTLGISDDDIQIQGDDLLLVLKEVDFGSVSRKYAESSLPFNYDKSLIANDHCIYLQCLYHLDYMKNGVVGGIYPTYRALNRIIYQERWSDFEEFNLSGIDYYSIRTISILENCKHHPLFRDLVEFIYKLDKYSLQYSKDSINKYDAMLNNSSGVGGFMYNQYGDKITGINNFETVKIIREISKR